MKVEPLPSSLITEIWPPISWASSRQIARPRPVPPYWRVVDESAWVNFSNSVQDLVLRDADAGVGDRQAQAPGVGGLEPRVDLAAGGELDGVGDQVAEDLAQPVAVAAPQALAAAARSRP